MLCEQVVRERGQVAAGRGRELVYVVLGGGSAEGPSRQQPHPTPVVAITMAIRPASQCHRRRLSSRGKSFCLQTYFQRFLGKQLSGLKLETYRRKQNRCGARGAYSAPAPRGYGAQLPGCRETGFSVSTEQLFLFFLAIWFFYFYLWG